MLGLPLPAATRRVLAGARATTVRQTDGVRGRRNRRPLTQRLVAGEVQRDQGALARVLAVVAVVGELQGSGPADHLVVGARKDRRVRRDVVHGEVGNNTARLVGGDAGKVDRADAEVGGTGVVGREADALLTTGVDAGVEGAVEND